MIDRKLYQKRALQAKSFFSMSKMQLETEIESNR